MNQVTRPTLTIQRPLQKALVELGLLAPDALEQYLKKDGDGPGRLGQRLVRDGLISERELARALAAQFGIECVDLETYVPDREALKLLSEKLIRTHRILPLEIREGTLTLAVHDPVETIQLEGFLMATGVSYRIAVATLSGIAAATEKAFGGRTSAGQLAGEPGRDNLSEKDLLSSIEPLLDGIIDQAIRDQASDIHIDPAEEHVRIRIRIDGQLHVLSTYPLSIHANVISRLKVIARMDIAERRVPQDGRFHYVCGTKAVDIRVSTLPTIKGEKAVMRIIDKSTLKGGFAELGMDPDTAKKLRALLDTPHGIIFITGPTGSGKTTTLYSMLNQINGTERNIITVEDPVEYQFDLINQVQVHERAGLGFAGLLKNILRQDPDVLMIGEVRDKDTADIAFQAALTGHLVLSTLHTNDAASTPTRLLDIGIEPFLMTSAMLGTLSQRLVRILCPHCKRKSELSEQHAALLGRQWATAGAAICIKAGCEKCYHTGYLGRVSLFELLIPDKMIQKAICMRKPEGEILAYARSIGFRTMRQDGIAKVLAGLTSVEEVVKTTM